MPKTIIAVFGSSEDAQTAASCLSASHSVIGSVKISHHVNGAPRNTPAAYLSQGFAGNYDSLGRATQMFSTTDPSSDHNPYTKVAVEVCCDEKNARNVAGKLRALGAYSVTE